MSSSNDSTWASNPEQALAKRAMVDHRTDIYSLGATLYELLTLEPAIKGQDREEILRRIAFDEARPPRQINKSVPPELDTIVLKAMAKVPEERYGTAQEVAEDLERFLEHKPIRAKRPGVVQRIRKFVRRHEIAVRAAVVASFVGLLLTSITFGFGMFKVKTELQNQIDAKKTLELNRPGKFSLAVQTSVVNCVAYSPDGGYLAAAGFDGIVRIWNARTEHLGERAGSIDGRMGPIYSVAFSPDGRRLAAAGGFEDHGIVKIWDRKAWEGK